MLPFPEQAKRACICVKMGKNYLFTNKIQGAEIDANNLSREILFHLVLSVHRNAKNDTVMRAMLPEPISC